MGDRQAALQKQLKEREQQELQTAGQPQQLDLFNSLEKEQFERNRQSLQYRLAQIPAELAKEQEIIHQRYTNTTARLFPLAIVLLVPPKIFKV
jgi:hypothetical protein